MKCEFPIGYERTKSWQTMAIQLRSVRMISHSKHIELPRIVPEPDTQSVTTDCELDAMGCYSAYELRV